MLDNLCDDKARDDDPCFFSYFQLNSLHKLRHLQKFYRIPSFKKENQFVAVGASHLFENKYIYRRFRRDTVRDFLDSPFFLVKVSRDNLLHNILHILP